MKVGYARISTLEQNLALQQDALEAVWREFSSLFAIVWSDRILLVLSVWDLVIYSLKLY